MPTTIKVKADIVVPRVPSFLRLAHAGDEAGLDVADVPDAALREIGASWTEALVAHAARRRTIPDRAPSRIPKEGFR